jgi:hypothetical protein
MQKFVPILLASSHVGEKTLLWWREIGRSLVSFTEIEPAVIDWAVFFATDRSLWQSRSMDDLKALVPELRRSLRKAGGHRLSADTRATLQHVLLAVATDPVGHRSVEIFVAPTADPGIRVGRDVRRRHGAEGGANCSSAGEGRAAGSGVTTPAIGEA